MRDVASLASFWSSVFFSIVEHMVSFFFFPLLGYPLSSASVALGGEREREKEKEHDDPQVDRGFHQACHRNGEDTHFHSRPKTSFSFKIDRKYVPAREFPQRRWRCQHITR